MANSSNNSQDNGIISEILSRCSLRDWRIDFSTATIVTMPDQYQRIVEADHVNELVVSFADRIWGKDIPTLKGILLSDLTSDQGTVLQHTTLHLFIGQHRGLALQKAFTGHKIDRESTIWAVSLYKKDLLGHPGLLRAIINSDNTGNEDTLAAPLLVKDAHIFCDLFRLPDRVQADIYCKNLAKTKYQAGLAACFRPNVFEQFQVLYKVAPWLFEDIAITGLRDLGNALMPMVLCRLLDEITEWWKRLGWNGTGYDKLTFPRSENNTASIRNRPSRKSLSIRDQLQGKGVNFTLVDSGPNKNRGLMDGVSQKVLWSFVDIPHHRYITSQMVSQLKNAALVANAVIWLLDPPKRDFPGTSEWRHQREQDAISQKKMAADKLAEFHLLCWRLRSKWKSEILKKGDLIRNLFMQDADLRKLVHSCPFTDIKVRCMPLLESIGPMSDPASTVSETTLTANAEDIVSEYLDFDGAGFDNANDINASSSQDVLDMSICLERPLDAARGKSGNNDLIDDGHRDVSGTQSDVEDVIIENQRAISRGSSVESIKLALIQSDIQEEPQASEGEEHGARNGEDEPGATEGEDKSETMDQQDIPEVEEEDNRIETVNEEDELRTNEGNEPDATDEEDEGSHHNQEKERIVHFSIHTPPAKSTAPAKPQRRQMDSETRLGVDIHQKKRNTAAFNRRKPHVPTLPLATTSRSEDQPPLRLAFQEQKLYDEALASVHRNLSRLGRTERIDYLRSWLSLTASFEGVDRGDGQHFKKRRLDSTPVMSSWTMSESEWIPEVLESIRLRKCLYIIGAGVSTHYGLSDDKTLLPQFEESLNWHAFCLNQDGERAKIWSLAREILHAKRMQRGMMHTLLNLIARLGRVTTIVSTNIDSLEIMTHDLLPQECHLWPIFASKNPSLDTWISTHSQCFVQLHGKIDLVQCSRCYFQYELTLSNVEDLINGTAKPCDRCRNGHDKTGTSSPIWRPGFTFHGDPREETLKEALDEEYRPPGDPGRAKRKGRDMRKDIDLSVHNRYLHALCQTDDAVLPDRIFVIGSSLQSPNLFRDVRNLSQRVPTFIVNTSWSSHFAKLSTPRHINAEAEYFASVMLRAMNSLK